MTEELSIRTAIDRHWAASAAGDQVAEHEIYGDDAVCEYPQSGEVIRGRVNLLALRSHHPRADPRGLRSAGLLERATSGLPNM
jgi:hypothetical protein